MKYRDGMLGYACRIAVCVLLPRFAWAVTGDGTNGAFSGVQDTSTGDLALGASSFASSGSSTALGQHSAALGSGSSSVGYFSKANGASSSALGTFSAANPFFGNYGTAIGSA